ncbi:hypothetical protein [Streptomyces sp. MS1.AVA.4]|uniref:Uncharacterized protein n=1 Tax=Streptomyces pratisoli TaxID=3139917 RepID=A0ACC6QKM4_9ACTN
MWMTYSMLRPPGKSKNITVGSWRTALMVVALILAIVPGSVIAPVLVVEVAGAVAGKPVTWISIRNWLAMLASCTLALSLTRAIGKHVHSAIISLYGNDEELRAREYVLYLRSFDVDKGLFWSESSDVWTSLSSLWKFAIGFNNHINNEATSEERILRRFLQFGRVVGVGRPGEEHPLPGAERFYLPLDDWQSDVSDAIKSARLVLMVAAAEGRSIPEGTLWEFTEALRLIPPSQFLLLVQGNEGEYRRFKELAAGFLTDRAAAQLGEHSFPSPTLPDISMSIRSGRIHKKSPLRGVVRFNDNWTGEFVEFDPNLERGTPRVQQQAMDSNQVLPLMELVERALPGRAVPAPRGSRWEVIGNRVPLLLILGVAVLPNIMSDERLLAAQKVTSVILLLLFAVITVINGFRIQELRRLHSTKVSFSTEETELDSQSAQT